MYSFDFFTKYLRNYFKKQKLIMLLSNYFWVFTLRIASKLKINLRQLIKCGVLLIIQIKEEIKVDSNWNGIITK